MYGQQFYIGVKYCTRDNEMQVLRTGFHSDSIQLMAGERRGSDQALRPVSSNFTSYGTLMCSMTH